MIYNPNWYYNPQCFNLETYNQMEQELQEYQEKQTEEVEKAFHAYKEFLDAYVKLDLIHQQELFCKCLLDFAVKNHW